MAMATGWGAFLPPRGWEGSGSPWGETCRQSAADGEHKVIATDEQWGPGACLASSQLARQLYGCGTGAFWLADNKLLEDAPEHQPIARPDGINDFYCYNYLNYLNCLNYLSNKNDLNCLNYLNYLSCLNCLNCLSCLNYLNNLNYLNYLN
jgi:hypothetical protein